MNVVVTGTVGDSASCGTRAGTVVVGRGTVDG